MLDLRHVHTGSVDAQGRRHISKVNPYLRLNAEGGPPVFIQKGKIHGSGGRELREKDIPEWLWKELETANRDRLKECGMTDTAIDKIIREGKQREEKAKAVEEEPVPTVTRKRGRPKKT